MRPFRPLPALALALLAAGLPALQGPAAGQTNPPNNIDVPPGLPPGLAARLAAGGMDGPEKKYEDFDKVTKGAKEYEGLFKLYQKDDHLYAEIRPEQFDRPLLAPIAVARGAGFGGDTLNADEEWVLSFRKVGEKVHLVRRNVHFKARPGTPEAKAVETTYTDSVLMALPIKTMNPMRGAVLIDLNQIFMTDFAGLGLGMMDPGRSYWFKVKTFPKNIELEVAATFSSFGRMGRMMMHGGDDSVIDPRGMTVVIHYGLLALPEDGYQPRVADDRIGYFLSAVKDFSAENPETAFVRYVNRWRLERADGSPWKEGGKLVPPKKRIVYWIERSVPDEYRAAVREGILEWNKAFEKVGFRDAIEVRQQENEDFDPEDVNYNTFRWVTNEKGYAIGPLRANPLTGEILDADILFDASMIRFYKREGKVFQNGAFVEPASAIQAARHGLTLPGADRLMAGWNDRASHDEAAADLRDRFRLLRQGACQCAAEKHSELGLALMAAQARLMLKPGEKVPDELIQQAVKETVMHEVGHTLGLRHNFKASTMLPNEKLHDVAVTRKQGLVGSVMDYNPVNLAPKGVKQGDYFTNTIGPYDYWAIEYGYKPLMGGTKGEEEELKKVASKGAQPGLAYGTDEDLYGTADPLINQWDLGSDPMKFAQDRAALAEELMKGLAERVVEKGEGYQRARQAFGMLLRQYGDAAFVTAKFVGGEMVNRDHKEDPNARDPFVPVTGVRQREALKYLKESVLSEKSFQFPPELLRKLAADRWSHWGNEMTLFGGVEYPLHERVLKVQRIVLDELLDGETLSRLQNLAVKSGKDDQALTIAEVFRAVTDGVWTDVPAEERSAKTPASSVMRRNLQREHLKHLAPMVLGNRSGGRITIAMLLGGGGFGGSVPADARSLARMHLKEIGGRIDRALADAKGPTDDATRAHLEECKERIAKVLAASMQVND
jgi:hypothetical protein